MKSSYKIRTFCYFVAIGLKIEFGSTTKDSHEADILGYR